MNRPKSTPSILMATAFASALFLGPLALSQSAASEAAGPTTDEAAALQAARNFSKAFKYAADVAAPSVVHISTYGTVTQQDFFGRRRTIQRQPMGMGTGIIVDADGHVVTNNHVVGGGSEFVVKLSDGRTLDATLVGRDPAIDIAVLDIDAGDLTPAVFGDSDALEIGEWVVAIGNPFGFDNTVTAGIVSAVGRSGLARTMGEHYEEFIQTDAAINPGNSGGPLLNLDGKVVGINTQIASASGGSNGLGFAIPANFVEPVSRMLIADGFVQRGWLGVGLPDIGLTVDEALARRIPLFSNEGGGVEVLSVSPRTPAADADLEPGDVIIRIDNRPTPTPARLRNAIAFTRPGTEITIEYVRGSKVFAAKATLADQFEGPGSAMNATFFRDMGLAVMGDIPADLDRLGVRGVTVVAVRPGSPAYEAGLRAGDIIEGVSSRETPSTTAFEAVIERLDPRSPAAVSIIRGDANSNRYFRDQLSLGRWAY